MKEDIFLYKKEETVKKIKPQIFRLVAVDCSYLGRVGISLFILSLTLPSWECWQEVEVHLALFSQNQ